MLHYTHTETAPWHVIAANHKWYTRVEALKSVVKQLSAAVDITPPPLAPEVTEAAYLSLGIKTKG